MVLDYQASNQTTFIFMNRTYILNRILVNQLRGYQFYIAKRNGKKILFTWNEQGRKPIFSLPASKRSVFEKKRDRCYTLNGGGTQ